jgi:hypothetical protein
MATFLELAQKLRQEVGAAGSGPAAVTGQTGEARRLVDWVRDAWVDIQAKQVAWSFLWAQFEKAVTDAESDYLVAEDANRVVPDTVRLNGQRLVSLEYGDYSRRIVTSPETVPQSFVILPDRKLRILPASNGTLTGDYYRTPQVLAANTDTPLAPAHLHEAIVAQAMIFYAAYEDAPEIYQDGSMRLRRWMTRLQNECLPSIELPGPLA